MECPRDGHTSPERGAGGQLGQRGFTRVIAADLAAAFLTETEVAIIEDRPTVRRRS